MFPPTCLSHRLVAPNKLFEYMAAGIPALGSDLPVIREFSEKWGFGATAHAEDPDHIAARIEELLDPVRNAACREAARRAASVVTWENERRVLERAYDEAASA